MTALRGPSRALHRRIATACADLGLDTGQPQVLDAVDGAGNEDGVEVRYRGQVIGTFVGNRLVGTDFAAIIAEHAADPAEMVYSGDVDIDPVARSLDQLAVLPPLGHLDCVAAFERALERSRRGQRAAASRRVMLSDMMEHLGSLAADYVEQHGAASHADLSDAMDHAYRQADVSERDHDNDRLRYGLLQIFRERGLPGLSARMVAWFASMDERMDQAATRRERIAAEWAEVPDPEEAAAHQHPDAIDAVARHIREQGGLWTLERVARTTFHEADTGDDALDDPEDDAPIEEIVFDLNDPLLLVRSVCEHLLPFSGQGIRLTPGVVAAAIDTRRGFLSRL